MLKYYWNLVSSCSLRGKKSNFMCACTYIPCKYNK